MNASPDPISACRHCRHYTPEGRRGGQCDQLDTLVHGDWKACPLALPAFAPSWESMEAHTVCAGPVPEPLEQNTQQQDTGTPPVLVAVGGGKSNKNGQRSVMGVVTETTSVAIS
ncbi:MAG: hypothetical protein AAGF75_03210 [Cyanobacteria bacterium P01_H01_bin.130]